MTTVHFARRALRDVAHIHAWWSSNRPAAPELFARELRGAVALLRASPNLGPLHELRVGDGVRRLLLRQTHHHVYYRHEPDAARVVIVAVWATQRGRMPVVR